MEEKKTDVQAAGNYYGPFTQRHSEWLLNSPGIILETTIFMHFSKYVIIFTVEISSDIALYKGILIFSNIMVSQDSN